MIGTFVLSNEDHHYHPLNVEHKGPDKPVLSDLGFKMNLDILREAKVSCVVCNVRLIEREDYVIQEPEPWEKDAQGV